MGDQVGVTMHWRTTTSVAQTGMDGGAIVVSFGPVSKWAQPEDMSAGGADVSPADLPDVNSALKQGFTVMFGFHDQRPLSGNEPLPFLVAVSANGDIQFLGNCGDRVTPLFERYAAAHGNGQKQITVLRAATAGGKATAQFRAFLNANQYGPASCTDRRRWCTG